MAILNDLVSQIEDKALRERIAAEVDKLAKQKKFGLVFEEHLPECTPLYDIPVKKGAKVALKAGEVNDFYTVLKIEDGKALCLNKDKTDTAKFAVDELVCIAEFGEPIYPYLKPIDTVCNAPDSNLWHTLIEADNYHALQLLEYLYAGKVDCIYIDPPYNTGARDWKYNNDYVDGNDQYRHSKWLSMMQKRLKIAKRLLNPNDSVLIITIDEKEYLHLGCLLEEMFPNALIQMISNMISSKGASRVQQFSRVDEYLFIVTIGSASVQRLPLSDEWRMNPDDKRGTKLRWAWLIREGASGTRSHSPGNFYPIFVDAQTGKYIGIGDPLPVGVDRNTVYVPDGQRAIWPLTSKGEEHYWNIKPQKFLDYKEKGYIQFGRFNANGMTIKFLTSGEIEKIENGSFFIDGYAEDGSVISTNEFRNIMPGTQWRITAHDATRHGTDLLKKILPGRAFPYPKSLYAVHDTINFFVSGKKNAIVLDFFAGSGTTLHAVNLLNAEDGGQRRCILVTNNEVSDEEAKKLTIQGYKPGDEEWEKLGIARYVTWPRTVCSIEGRDVNGNPLKGNYIGSDLPMADGFKANAAYFKLGFLDKTKVSLGMQFKEILPTLWMKAGAHGPCPTIKAGVPDMLILPENKFAVLVDEKQYIEFSEKLDEHPEIETVYIVTDSESGYRDMIAGLNVKESFQFYRDYLDNFRINSVRR